MINQIVKSIKYIDVYLLAFTGLIILIGLFLLYATTYSSSAITLFNKQLLYAILGLIVFVFIVNFDYHLLAKQSKWVYIVSVILLALLLLIGRAIRGSARWFDLGFFNFQPSELVKLIVILGLARLLYLKRGEINTWKSLLLSALYTFVPAILVLMQPDLGSSLVIIAIWFGMLIASRVKKKYLLSLIAIFLVSAIISWFFVLHDYQKTRVEVFLNPSLDSSGRGYNVRQAIISVGSGGLFGSGLGKGLQSQLRFLPERYTDFIFATIAEQVGLLGTTLILVLYVGLLYRIIVIMKKAKDELGYFLAAGAFWFFFVQFTINVGMNIGVLPVTGIPLPFVSYGGSALLVSAAVCGLVQNIAMQSKSLRF